MTVATGPGERVVWQGKPAQGIRFTPADIFAIPFALFWCVITVSFFLRLAAATAGDMDPVGYLFLSVFLLFGLHMLVGRLLLDSAVRRSTRYCLTNRRAVIEGGLFRRSRRSVNLAAVPEIRFRGGRKGRGTIHFGSNAFHWMIPPGWPGAGQFSPPAFEHIPDAERVYELVLTAQREAQTR